MQNDFEIIEVNFIYFLNERDDRARAFIKALYEPAILEAMKCFDITGEKMQSIYECAVTATLDREYKFKTPIDYLNYLFVKITDIIGPTGFWEGSELFPNSICSTLKRLKTEFRKVLIRRMKYAEDCNSGKAVFNMQSSEGKAILKEIFWPQLVVQCWGAIQNARSCSSIIAIRAAIPIVDVSFDNLFEAESKFDDLTTFDAIRDTLFTEVKLHVLIYLGKISEN